MCSLIVTYVLYRLEEQCGEHYKELAATWYKGVVVRILFSKNNKVNIVDGVGRSGRNA